MKPISLLNSTTLCSQAASYVFSNGSLYAVAGEDTFEDTWIQKGMVFKVNAIFPSSLVEDCVVIDLDGERFKEHNLSLMDDEDQHLYQNRSDHLWLVFNEGEVIPKPSYGSVFQSLMDDEIFEFKSA